MKVVVKVKFNNLKAITAEMVDGVDRVTEGSARAIAQTIVVDMNEPKSGEMYGSHQASAPGESPAVDLAALVNSIQAERLGPMKWAVTTNQEYAPVLEYGGVNMSPRPFMTPAADAEGPQYEKKVKEVLSNAGS